MKIGIHARELDGKSGTQTYLSNILPELATHIDDSLMVCSQTKTCFAERSNIIHANTSGIPVFSEHLTTPFVMHKNDVDVAWYPKNVIPFINDLPTVVTIHDLGHFINSNYYPYVDRNYQKLMLRFACRFADRIIAISESTKSDILEYTSADPERVHVVHHGVSEEFSSDYPKAKLDHIRDKYNLSETVVYGGNIAQRKNTSMLIDAFANSIIGEQMSTELVFTGTKPPNKIVDRISQTDSVRYLGYISDSEVPLFYNIADVFVYPSLYEGFGLPVLEAMASGTPVIASSRASLPEVVGDAGLLVDPSEKQTIIDTLDMIFQEEDIRENLIQKGIKRANQFTWEKSAKKTARILRRCESEA